MNLKMVFYVLGVIMKVEAALMMLPALVSVIYKDNELLAFLIPAVLLFAIGFALSFRKPENNQLLAREGFIIVSLSWIVLSLFGSLPYVLSGEIPNFIDALFETVSGFTTTGASILTDIEALSHSTLFWRSFTNWIGGMGVLVFVLAFLPSSDTRYMYVMRAEVPGPVVGKLVSKIKVTARILYVIYIVMTVLLFVFLLLGGMPVFDSIVHAIATAGTGGFSIKNSSIAFYDSAYIDYVVSIFMVLFGINFNLFYFMIIGRVVTILKDEELKFYLGLILISILAVSLNIRSLYDGNILTAFRYASFQVTSIVSTSGFATADFTQWPFFSQFLIIILMLTGGCAGSTAGGIKIRRFLIFIKMGFVEIKKLINPRSVVQLKVDSKVQQDTLLSGIAAYFSIYVLIFAASTIIVSLDAKSAGTTLGSVLTCLSNVGPGFGAAGPSGNFSIFSSLSKFVLMVDMLVGRLELFPIILLFTPNTWRRV